MGTNPLGGLTFASSLDERHATLPWQGWNPQKGNLVYNSRSLLDLLVCKNKTNNNKKLPKTNDEEEQEDAELCRV